MASNEKKRKLDVCNACDTNQPSKKRKLMSSLKNIFDQQKELKNEINVLKKERDKYKKETNYFQNQIKFYQKKVNKYDLIYSKMIAIVQQTHEENEVTVHKNDIIIAKLKEARELEKNGKIKEATIMYKTAAKLCPKHQKLQKKIQQLQLLLESDVIKQLRFEESDQQQSNVQNNKNSNNKNANTQHKNLSNKDMNVENTLQSVRNQTQSKMELDDIDISVTNENRNNVSDNDMFDELTGKENDLTNIIVNKMLNIIAPYQTNYYCKKCNRYFKNGQELGGHNSRIHSNTNTTNLYKSNRNVNDINKRNVPLNSKLNKMFAPYQTNYYCKECNRYFENGHALCGHQYIAGISPLSLKNNSRIQSNTNTTNSCQSNRNVNNINKRTICTNLKLNNNNNNKWKYKTNESDNSNFNACHYISVNCKLCKQHFDDFDKYCRHLKSEFDNDLNKKWLYCNNETCDNTKKYSKQHFIVHLAKHGYKRPFYCNLNAVGYNDTEKKCSFTSNSKGNMKTHLENIHKKSFGSKKTKIKNEKLINR